MKKSYCGTFISLSLSILVLFAAPAFAWHDKTHLAIAQAAGYENWHNAAGPDVTKTKSGDIEATNHWYNNNANVEVTAELVLKQADRYNNSGDTEGHLYGAIIASLREYIKGMKEPGKYGEYHMAFCSHYIGDLGMPLHNMPHGDDRYNNRDRHTTDDGVIEFGVLNNIGLIQKNVYEIKIENESDLAREIARIANKSHKIALKIEKEHRDNKERKMTADEAYAQIYHSASLLKAVLNYTKMQK